MNYPFVSPVLISWIGIVLIVFVTFFFISINRRAKYRMLEKFAEKGQPIPPEFLRGSRVEIDVGPDNDWKNGNPIASGISLMCIGIALALFFWAMQGWGNPFTGEDVGWLPAIGLFPFMTGLARLLSAAFVRPKDKS